jgi:hypothetical protein
MWGTIWALGLSHLRNRELKHPVPEPNEYET